MSKPIIPPSSINANGALIAMRNHLTRKNTYIVQTAKENTRPIRKDGFNPKAILIHARSVTKNSKASDVLFIIGHYTQQDYESWVVDRRFVRWNPELKCVEVAKRRHLEKGEKVSKDLPKEKKHLAYYPENEAEWEFVPVMPGTVINYSDFNKRIGSDRENTLALIIDLLPKKKSQEQIDKFPQDVDYSWGVGGVNTNLHTFPPYVMPSLMKRMPPSVFHLPNPNKIFRRYAILRTADMFNDESLAEIVTQEAYTFAQLISSTVEDDYGYDDKNESKPAILPATTGGKKRNTKCMKLLANITQKNEGSDAVQTIAAHVIMWENVIEEAFRVRDIHLWFNCMRYVAPAISDAVFVAAIGLDRTSNSAWNAQTDQNEGEALLLDAEANDDAMSVATPATAPDLSEKTGVDDDFDALLAQDQASEALKASSIKAEKIDYYLHTTVTRAIFDFYDFCKKFLIPVVPSWVTTPVKDANGKLVPKAFMAPTSDKYQALEVNARKLAHLPDVICASEYKKDIKALNELVVAKLGEWRVAVNTPTYGNANNSKAFVQAIRSLTPEEGTDLLDGKQPNGKNITWTKPESAQYVLFFLNYAARDPLKIEEALKRSNSLLIEHKILGPEVAPLEVPHHRFPVTVPNTPATPAVSSAETVAGAILEPSTPAVPVEQMDTATGPVLDKAVEKLRKERRSGRESDEESESRRGTKKEKKPRTK